MSRKSYMEQACHAVPGFKTISEKFIRKYTIAGKSESCTRNYLMQISKMVLHFGCSPLELSIDQMEEYLFHLRQWHGQAAGVKDDHFSGGIRLRKSRQHHAYQYNNRQPFPGIFEFHLHLAPPFQFQIVMSSIQSSNDIFFDTRSLIISLFFVNTQIN